MTKNKKKIIALTAVVAALIILVAALFASGIISRLTSSDNIEFICEDFSLELPKSWEGKYAVTKLLRDNAIYYRFHHKEISGKHESLGRIFAINVSLSDASPHLRQELIAEKDGFRYVFSLPTDVQYPGILTDADDEDKLLTEEYHAMSEDTEAIKNSFKLIDRSYDWTYWK